MKKSILFILPLIALILTHCNVEVKDQLADQKNITDQIIQETQEAIIAEFGTTNQELIQRGVNNAALLWRASDGTPEEFKNFCIDQYINDASEKKMVFEKISSNFESLWGHQNKIMLDLNKNLHEMREELGDPHKIDAMFAAYSPGAHLKSDFYSNKIAFVIALNFPPYSLDEKNEMGKNWSTLQWAYARLGDVFTARVPAEISQKISAAGTNADIYIADYNIYMGHLLNNDGSKLFPEDMVLLSHWNLRDEIKSNYANQENGLEKQDMIYTVMKHIIHQTIPQKVINSSSYDWNPIENKVYQGEKEIQLAAEPDTRYQMIIDNFKANKAADEFYAEYNTFIKRAFSGSKEIPQEEVEKLFDAYLSSPVAKEVGQLITKRL